MNRFANTYDEGFESLAQRTERVLGIVRDADTQGCAACGGAVCGHERVFSIVAGHQDHPVCLPCLAVALEREPEGLRDELVLFAHSKPCLTQGWRLASIQESQGLEGLPRCLWPAGADSIDSLSAAAQPAPSADEPVAQAIDDRWDAGELGCGELVLKLRKRVADLPSRGVIELIALDLGAVEDIPAWCRLTGHELVTASHPQYQIRRKD